MEGRLDPQGGLCRKRRHTGGGEPSSTRALLLPRRAQFRPLPTSPLLPPQGITGEHSPDPSPPLPCSHLRASQESTVQAPSHLSPAPTPGCHCSPLGTPFQGQKLTPPPLPPQCGPMYSKLFPPTTHSTPKTRRRGSSTQYPRSQGPRAFQTVLTCWEPCQPAVWAGQGGSPRGLISCTHSASQLLRLSTPSWDADCPSVLCPRKGSVYKCPHLQNPGTFPH